MTELASPHATRSGTFGVVASLQELIGLRAHPHASWVRRAVRSATAPGTHTSSRKSRGMEFSESRPYQSGDDVRTLDWRQTARRGRPYTKLFQEEHERPVQLLVDLGPSMRFGTRVAFKSVVAARAAALLAWRAVADGDRVGGLLWNGGDMRVLRPQGRHHGALTLIGGLAAASAATPATHALSLSAPLSTMARTLRPGSLMVIISDFNMLDSDAQRLIVALSKTSELVLLHVYDRFEAEAPPPGSYRITDGQRSLVLDLRSDAARSAYGAAFAERRLALEKLARRDGVTLMPLATHLAPETVLTYSQLHLPGSIRLPSLRTAP